MGAGALRAETRLRGCGPARGAELLLCAGNRAPPVAPRFQVVCDFSDKTVQLEKGSRREKRGSLRERRRALGAVPVPAPRASPLPAAPRDKRPGDVQGF